MLTSQKPSSILGLSGVKSFHGFISLDERMMPIVFLAFYLAIIFYEVLVIKNSTKTI